MPVTVQGYADANPAPRVDITVSSYSASVTTMTVTRDYGVGTPTTVSGALNQPAVGGFFVTDYWAPLNVPITYTATGYSSTGAVLVTLTSTPVTLTEASKFSAWVSDPLDPASALKVILERKNAGSLSYPAESTVLRPLGRRSGILVSGTRAAAASVPISLITLTVDDADSLRDLMWQANPLCLRPATITRMPALSYPSAPDPSEEVLMDGTTHIWSWTADLVSPPSAAVVVPVHTWAEVTDAYSTWTQLMAARPTWLDVVKDPT